MLSCTWARTGTPALRNCERMTKPDLEMKCKLPKCSKSKVNVKNQFKTYKIKKETS